MRAAISLGPRLAGVALACALAASGCGDGAGAMPGATAMPDLGDPSAIPADPQRAGDPAKGWDALVNNGYVSGGIPDRVFSMFFGKATPDQMIPGRTGRNAALPYFYTAFKTASGVDVVSANCLTCHAGRMNGELIVGLGNSDQDFTVDLTPQAEVAGQFIPDSDAKAKMEWRKWADRVGAIAPYTRPLT